MVDLKISDALKALAKSWFGLGALLILLVLVAGCVWAFCVGNIVLGIVLAIVTAVYLVALVYLILWAWIVALVVATFIGMLFSSMRI